MEIDTLKSNNFPIAPDVAHESKAPFFAELDWVGMTEVLTPIRYSLPHGETALLPAKVAVGVSLVQPEARGIHMSRLFSILQNGLTRQALNSNSLVSLGRELLDSQVELSSESKLKIQWELPVERTSLISGEKGWRQYPVWMSLVSKKDTLELKIGVEVLYSSTCPCSGALAKQLILNKFDLDFANEEKLSKNQLRLWLDQNSLLATPHAQRSRARVEVVLTEMGRLTNPELLIEQVEMSLGTPVQAMVKRLDEQEFARLNGQNMMFCEDAARKLKGTLDSDLRYSDFSIEVEHQESLHAHNAVARVRK